MRNYTKRIIYDLLSWKHQLPCYQRRNLKPVVRHISTSIRPSLWKPDIFPSISDCYSVTTKYNIVHPITRKIYTPLQRMLHIRNYSLCNRNFFRNDFKTFSEKNVYNKFILSYSTKSLEHTVSRWRKPRMKPTRITAFDKDSKTCVAYCTGESYNMELLRAYFVKHSTNYTMGTLPKDANDVLYITKRNTKPHERGDIFFFRRLGAFVGWDMEEKEILALREIIRHYELRSYPTNHTDEEFEEMNFSHTENATSLMEGDICLNSNNSLEGEVLEKYAFSNAMALSVKLAMWEIALDTFSDSMREIPELLKSGKQVKLTRKEILQKIGELISLRHQIYLYSDLLTTPDFFWERDDLEKLYTKTCAYLEIAKRAKIMNEKMNLCSELVEMLRSHLNERHSHRLEWMIIILITVEVLFEVLRLL